jgi:hypothetical protein
MKPFRPIPISLRPRNFSCEISGDSSHINGVLRLSIIYANVCWKLSEKLGSLIFLNAAWIRRCAVASLGALVLSPVVATETAHGQGAVSEWPATHSAGAHPRDATHAHGAAPAQANEQHSSTGQAASANAYATDPQPTNIFVSIRINSPGDNGSVAQTSTTAVAGSAANDASTAQGAWQDWDSGGQAAGAQPQASEQDSGTDQAAAATATATHPRPTNTVVYVRVNSPGDDAPVTQTSTVVVGAESKNAAATTQNADQAQVGAPSAAPATSTPATSSTAPAPKRPRATAAPSATAAPPSAAPHDARAPAACVSIPPGPAGKAAARVVITIGASCPSSTGTRPAARPTSADAPSTAPPAPAVREARPPATSTPVAATGSSADGSRTAAPRPVPVVPRARISEPRSLVPHTASAGVGHLAAARSPSLEVEGGGRRDEVIVALLVATLGAAAIWSYVAAHPRRSWRKR